LKSARILRPGNSLQKQIVLASSPNDSQNDAVYQGPIL
jgi:hypothetical protein